MVRRRARGGGRGGRGGQTGLNNNNTRNTGRTALRIPFRLGFEMPRVPAQVLRATVQRRITKLPGLQAANKVVAVIEKDTAVLQGTVTNSDQGDLIAGLMLLEPGVYKVRNELVVKAPNPKTTKKAPSKRKKTTKRKAKKKPTPKKDE